MYMCKQLLEAILLCYNFRSLQLTGHLKAVKSELSFVPPCHSNFTSFFGKSCFVYFQGIPEKNIMQIDFG